MIVWYDDCQEVAMGLVMTSLFGGEDDRVEAGTETWLAEEGIAIRDEHGDMVDVSSRCRRFSNPVAARRWARGRVSRRKTDFGHITIQQQRAEQAEHVDDGIGEWVDVGEPEYID